MTNTRNCTCAGTAPGYPQHEPFCGQAEFEPEIMATERQRTFAARLLAERDTVTGFNAAWIARFDALRADMSDLTKSGATKLIDVLLDAPKLAVATPDVPAGRYAITVNGEVKFYRVDRPEDGKWAGYTFVKVLVGPEEWPLRGASATAVLAVIADDAKAAAVLYGHEIGRCCICNRRLTVKASRDAGIGPVCAEKF